MKWKPIDTAPKDGTYIFIHRKGCDAPCVGNWFNGSSDTIGKPWPPAWRGVDTGSTVLGTPTHWMPLPALPE